MAGYGYGNGEGGWGGSALPSYGGNNPYQNPGGGGGGTGGGTDWGSIGGSAASGIGTAFAAWMGAKAADEATKSQLKMMNEAIQFEQDKEAERKREWEQSMAMNKAQWQASEARRQALAQRYGIQIG